MSKRKRRPWDPSPMLERRRTELRALQYRVSCMEDELFEHQYGGADGIDLGVRAYVKCLRACGVETYESCEGGPGHAFPEPTVRFTGSYGAGWKAVGFCLEYGLPIAELRRVWNCLDGNQMTGPNWEITFRKKCC